MPARKPKAKPPLEAMCLYCGGRAVHHPTSVHVYGRDCGPIWECAPCDARVGCHPNGRPLGRLAKKPLREAKGRAHAAFDPLWKAAMARDQLPSGRARARGYRWLAAQLGIEPKACHIALFDEAQCERTVQICTPLLPGAKRMLARLSA